MVIKMKKLALFDLDGTLFNTNDVNYYSYLNAVKGEGIHIDYEFWCKECNGRHYQYFLPKLGITEAETMERIHKHKKEEYENFLNYAKPNKHLFHLIDILGQSYYKGIVTTASRKNTMDILNYFDKTDLFDLILTQEDIHKLKPDSEGYVKAMDFFNASKEDTMIFEDSDVGILAALETGASVFVVENF